MNWNDKILVRDIAYILRNNVKEGLITPTQATALAEDMGVKYSSKVSVEAHLYSTTNIKIPGINGWPTYFFTNPEGRGSFLDIGKLLEEEGFSWSGGDKVKVTIEKVD